jgi:hypothetical protein
MPHHHKFNAERALAAAKRIARSSDSEWAAIFGELLREKRLFATVHQLNRLLVQPAHRAVAASALRRIGLDRGG